MAGEHDLDITARQGSHAEEKPLSGRVDSPPAPRERCLPLRELKPHAKGTGRIDIGRPIPAWALGHAIFAPQGVALGRQVTGYLREVVDTPGHMIDPRTMRGEVLGN